MVQKQSALVTRHRKKGSAQTMDIEPLLTVVDVAERLHVSRTYVYLLIRRGGLGAVRIGHVLRVRPEVLRGYMESMDRPSRRKSRT